MVAGSAGCGTALGHVAHSGRRADRYGSDPAALATTATRVPGGWQIDGRKTFITRADGAGFLIVMAPRGAAGERDGGTMFLTPADVPGLQVGRHVPTGDRDRRVAEDLRDDLERNAGVERHAGGRVPEGVCSPACGRPALVAATFSARRALRVHTLVQRS